MTTKAESQHMSIVASLNCLICKSPAQIHHTGTHLGGGRDHSKVIPLCALHHTNGGYGVALHAGKAYWESLYGTEEDLLKQVDSMLEWIK